MRVRARSLDGAVVVLVGASSGIGRATALAFAGHGADLVLAARSSEALEEVASECRDHGVATLVVPTDVADSPAVEALAARATEHYGRIDVWVHAASVLVAGDLVEHTEDDLQRLVDVNVVGALQGSRVAVRQFRAQRSGTLIVVSSLLGVFPNPLAPAYVTSKFATRGLALSLRHAVADERDIHVCIVLPGPVDTPIFEHAANRTGRQLRAIPPAVAPERIAAAILACARRPRRETTAGIGNRALLMGHRVAPWVAEWIVAWWSAKLLTREAPAPDGPGSLADVSAQGEVHGGYRRSGLRRRIGNAVGRLLAGRGRSATLRGRPLAGRSRARADRDGAPTGQGRPTNAVTAAE